MLVVPPFEPLEGILAAAVAFAPPSLTSTSRSSAGKPTTPDGWPSKTAAAAPQTLTCTAVPAKAAVPLLILPPGVASRCVPSRQQELAQAELHMKNFKADGRDGHAAVPAKDTLTPPTGLNQAPLVYVPSTVPAKDPPPTPAKQKPKPRSKNVADMTCTLCSKVFAASAFPPVAGNARHVHTTAF